MRGKHVLPILDSADRTVDDDCLLSCDTTGERRRREKNSVPEAPMLDHPATDLPNAPSTNF